MRFVLQVSFSLLTALVLSLVFAVPQQAQVKSKIQDAPGKGLRGRGFRPLGATVVAENYLVTQTTGAIEPGTSLVTGYNCGAGAPGDDCIAPVALPFSFTLYDATFSSVNVSTNGNLQFSSNTQPLPLEACLPISQFNYVILAHHGDLTINGVNEGIFT